MVRKSSCQHFKWRIYEANLDDGNFAKPNICDGKKKFSLVRKGGGFGKKETMAGK